MKEAYLSVEELYNKCGESLNYCTVSTKDNGYYDLQTPKDGTVCMDGEKCKIIGSDNNIFTLINVEGEKDCEFQLTKEEFEIAILYKKAVKR